MQPPTPPLNSLRLATPSDIDRIAVVAVSGFFYSPTFQWYRPYHASYPSDTLTSYRRMFAGSIQNPRHIVLVAVDKYKPDEAGKSSAMIPKDGIEGGVEEGEEVIVCVAVWILEEGSKRVGQFQANIEHLPEVPVSSDRDVHKEHLRLYREKLAAAQHNYFKNSSELDMLVCHPAYWRRGHAGALAKWGLELAKMDGVSMGVVGAHMGVKLYKDLGFKHLIYLKWEGDEAVPAGLELEVLRFEP